MAILATGGCVQTALAAHDALRADGIAARVLNVHTLKPLDRAAVERAARETGRLVTVEEHFIDGGLGGAVAEVLAELGGGRLRRVGVRDRFCTEVAPYPELLRTARHRRGRRGTAAVRELITGDADVGCTRTSRAEGLAMPADAAALAPCPSSPNCVSSLAADAAHHDRADRLQRRSGAGHAPLRAVIEAMPRTRIVERQRYRRCAPSSPAASFASSTTSTASSTRRPGVIQIRSASRVGYSDLGANRKRVEAIRAAFARSAA